MSVETDTLADAAQRFADAIKVERTATMTALEQEREAALKIIAALRRENARHARASGGRFVLGFLIGAAIGAAAVVLLAPRPGEAARASLTANLNDAGQSLSERIKGALEAGRRAASSREQELWSQYHKRIAESTRPSDSPSPL